MQINEIFSSIDGEGIRTGHLVTFIRTQFCSLNCTYCDTSYSLTACDESGNKQYVDMTVDDIVDKCKQLGNKRITFTGGEPLIQKDALQLVSKLTTEGFEVNIETNGNIDISSYYNNSDIVSNNLIMTMDWKSPYSGMRQRMLQSNLSLLTENDVLKFVVADSEDLQDMLAVVTSNDLKCHIFVSPVFGKIVLSDIVDFLKEHNLQNVRMQLQLHKIIWEPEMRGV